MYFFQILIGHKIKTVILFMHSEQKSSLILQNNSLSKKLMDQRRSLSERHFLVLLRKKDDVLQGQRGVRYPLIALTTQRSMGPARHALSQKVVGGTMTIHPPFERSKSSIQTTNNSRSKFWREQ